MGEIITKIMKMTVGEDWVYYGWNPYCGTKLSSSVTGKRSGGLSNQRNYMMISVGSNRHITMKRVESPKKE